MSEYARKLIKGQLHCILKCFDLYAEHKQDNLNIMKY